LPPRSDLLPGLAAGKIVTLTLSPALDLSSSVEVIEPWRKMRCETVTVHPGGGGINVARAVRALGGQTLAVVALGGHVGSQLAKAMRRSEIPLRRVSVRVETRQNYAVTERSSSQQFRFVHPAGRMSPAEWEKCLDATVENARHASVIVASSSIPDGAPPDAFAMLADRLAPLGVPCIVDTSGPALLSALTAAIAFAKPSVNELRAITGESLTNNADYERAARHLLDDGRCQLLAISLGAEGALFVPRTGDAFVVRAPKVQFISTSGAGDSMVAGMAMAIARGDTLIDTARFGVAAGTAATLAPGTTLCRPEDVARLLPLTTVTGV
jgi:6-phosphofructokinase 2